MKLKNRNGGYAKSKCVKVSLAMKEQGGARTSLDKLQRDIIEEKLSYIGAVEKLRRAESKKEAPFTHQVRA